MLVWESFELFVELSSTF